MAAPPAAVSETIERQTTIEVASCCKELIELYKKTGWPLRVWEGRLGQICGKVVTYMKLT